MVTSLLLDPSGPFLTPGTRPLCRGKDGGAVDRCALFVDAGYALSDGALAVHGTRHRDSVSWDYAGLIKLLAGLSRDRTGLPVLDRKSVVWERV